MPGALSFQQWIKPVSTMTRPKSICIVGKPKAGKTTLAASAYEIAGLRAAGKGVLILEAESGTASIASAYPNVDQVPIANHIAFEQVVNELLTVPHNYGVVIVDTYDKMQKNARDHMLAVGASNTQKAWGDVGDWTEKTAWKLHNAPFLVIFLIHETTEKNDRTAQWMTNFGLQGGSVKSLGQVFDIIGHLTVKTDPNTGQSVRTLQVGQQEGNVTGNRYESFLPSSIDNPTIPGIFELIEAGIPTTAQSN